MAANRAEAVTIKGLMEVGIPAMERILHERKARPIPRMPPKRLNITASVRN